ncbi:MAG TPA: histidine kinase, partial [Rhodospirillaceae bacterium]|nr:histidine kinase [Rhodospirillaceae bacterium]
MKNTWRFGDSEFGYIREVLDSGFGSSTSGNMNKRFEDAFAEKIGADYAVALNSGTSTLHAALAAVGVGYGDEVITAPLTVISNLDVILSLNAIPVFADVDPDTFNIDPDDVAAKITSKTKAIMPISIYGLSCDLDPLMALGKKHGIAVINDAAEAF